MKRIILQILLLSAIIGLSGCGLLASTEKSAEVVSFQKGELSSKIKEDFKTTYTATQAVATESQFVIKSDRADAFSAVLKCEDAQQRKVDIILEKETENLTRIKIRVGLLGDAELSTKLFEQINKKARD